PGTKLKMSVSLATGPGTGSETAYQKTVNRLDLASMLTVEDGRGAARTLYVSGTDLDPAERDNLALPALPPTGALDARSGEGTAFVFRGENTLLLNGEGRLVLAMPVASPRVRIEVRDEQEQLLHTFTGAE